MIMHVVGVVVKLSNRPIVDRLLIAVSHTVVALLKLPMRVRRVCLRRDRDSQRRRSGDYFEVEGRYIPLG